MEDLPAFSSGDIDAMNQEFYSDSPATYLRQRLMLLVAFADDRSPLDDVFSTGVSLGRVKVERGDDGRGPTHDPSGYAAIEGVALAYAVSESLLRHLAAHETLPLCPWIEISGLLDPGALHRFARTIAEAGDEALLDRFRPALRGSHDRPNEIAEDQWESDGKAISDLLRTVADVFSTYVDANNALKHGGAILVRNPALRIGRPEDATGVIFDVAGPAIKYLSRKRVQRATHEWREVTRFVNIEALTGQAALFLTQLEAIWAVARARYIGDLSGKLRMLSPTELSELRTMPTGSGLTGLINLAMTRTWARTSG